MLRRAFFGLLFLSSYALAADSVHMQGQCIQTLDYQIDISTCSKDDAQSPMRGECLNQTSVEGTMEFSVSRDDFFSTPRYGDIQAWEVQDIPDFPQVRQGPPSVQLIINQVQHEENQRYIYIESFGQQVQMGEFFDMTPRDLKVGVEGLKTGLSFSMPGNVNVARMLDQSGERTSRIVYYGLSLKNPSFVDCKELKIRK